METLLAAETTLSLIPSLVKMSPLSVPDLTLLRLAAVGAVSLIGADLTDLYSLDISQWFYPTIITIVHVVSSYLGFKLVPNVWSQVIFYSYPFFILIGSSIFLNESIKLFDIMWFIPLMFFIYLLYADTIENSNKDKREKEKNITTFDWTVGIVALLVSALTEASYFIFFRKFPLSGSWNRLAVSYIGAAFIYLIYYLATRQNQKDIKKEKTPRSWLFAIMWNVIVAGFGYWARFYSIDKVEPIVYSALSYTGLITGHIFAVLFGIDAFAKVDVVSILGVLFSILGLTLTPHLLGSSSILVSS